MQRRTPVLLIERLYTVGTVSNEALRSLETFAQRRAEELGLPLVTADGAGTPYGHEVKSLGGLAPYGYSDGAHGVCPRGVSIIARPMVVSQRGEEVSFPVSDYFY